MPLGGLGKVVGGDGLSVGDHAEDLDRLVEKVRTVEVAKGFQVATARWLSLGDRDQEVVAEHAPERPVDSSSVLQPPIGQSSSGFEPPAIEHVESGKLAPAIFLRSMFDGVEEGGEFGFGPVDPTHPSQVGFQEIGEFQEMPDVFQGVTKLGLGEGPSTPIGPGLAPQKRITEGLVDQVSQGKRITEADQARGDLDVEDATGHRAGLQSADPQILARRVHDHFQRRVDHSVPERGKVAHLERVDDRHPRGCRHLDQAEHRLEGVFRDKLGVKGEAAGVAEVLDEFPESLRVRDQGFRFRRVFGHGSARRVEFDRGEPPPG